MSTVVLTGSDTLTINGRNITDLADGDAATLEFANNIADLKTGKNGNAIYSLNETGKQADLKIRLIRGSADDKYMLNLLSQQKANFAGFVLVIGQFIKKLGDGKGGIGSDIYTMNGGIFMKEVSAKTNAEGDVNQSVAEYTMKFSNAPRSIT